MTRSRRSGDFFAHPAGATPAHLLSRGVYQEEYEASLRNCMAGAPGFEELQEAHDRHLASVRAHPAMFALTKKLRGVKPLEAPHRL